MTRAQISRQQEVDQKAREGRLAELRLKAKREVTEEDYAKLVDSPNLNRESDLVHAKSVEGALDGLATLGLSAGAARAPLPQGHACSLQEAHAGGAEGREAWAHAEAV